MIVTALVEIEFEVPEGTDLRGAYVGVASDLFDMGGNLIVSCWECDTIRLTPEDK